MNINPNNIRYIDEKVFSVTSCLDTNSQLHKDNRKNLYKNSAIYLYEFPKFKRYYACLIEKDLHFLNNYQNTIPDDKKIDIRFVTKIDNDPKYCTGLAREYKLSCKTFYDLPINLKHYRANMNNLKLMDLIDIATIVENVPQSILRDCADQRDYFKNTCLYKTGQEVDLAHEYPIKLLNWIMNMNLKLPKNIRNTLIKASKNLGELSTDELKDIIYFTKQVPNWKNPMFSNELNRRGI